MLRRDEDYYIQLEVDGKIFNYTYEEKDESTFMASSDSILQTLFPEDASNIKNKYEYKYEYGTYSYSSFFPNSIFTNSGFIIEYYGPLQIKVIPELQTNQETYDKYDDVDELLNNLQFFARINEREKFFSYCIVYNDDQDMEKFYSFMKDLAIWNGSLSTISKNNSNYLISYETEKREKYDLELQKNEGKWCIHI